MTAPNPLPDALDCFWNAALRVAHDRQNDTVFGVVSAIVEGVQAVSNRLRELDEQAATPATSQEGEGGALSVTLNHAARLLETLSRVTRYRTIDPNVPLGLDIAETATRLAFLAATPTPPDQVRPKAIAPDEWAAAKNAAHRAIEGQWRRGDDVVQVIAEALGMERARS